MESAKAAVKDFMSKAGHHDTTVHEKVAPAVTHETVSHTQHENVQTAVDKEIHQDHYHTSVQPVTDRERLPEQHHHNLAGVEHRSFEHGNSEDVQQRLAVEQAKHRDHQQHVKGEHTTSAAPTVAGEHIHHHVHETIQPVVQKETIEPHVVHTTVPIHEVHHNAAQHHASSALPAVSMADFQKQGGSLTGREERSDGFQGEPRTVGNEFSAGQGSNTSGTATGSNSRSSDLDSGLGSSTRSNVDSTSGASKAGKASLMDKVNPKVDADGDGKAGFMK